MANLRAPEGDTSRCQRVGRLAVNNFEYRGLKVERLAVTSLGHRATMLTQKTPPTDCVAMMGNVPPVSARPSLPQRRNCHGSVSRAPQVRGSRSNSLRQSLLLHFCTRHIRRLATVRG